MCEEQARRDGLRTLVIHRETASAPAPAPAPAPARVRERGREPRKRTGRIRNPERRALLSLEIGESVAPKGGKGGSLVRR
eukprot:6199105-Pleurochrysis_carterae.AAC.3